METLIFNQDCIKFFTTLSDNSVDCVICDLPYYNIVEDSFDKQWDSLDDYIDWVEYCLLHVMRILKQNGNLLLFCSRQNTWRISSILAKIGFTENRMIIWARKRGFNNTRGKALSSGYEQILFWSKGTSTTFNQIKVKPNINRKEYKTGVLKNGINLSDVWEDIPALPHNSKEKTIHPTQKPLKLMERIVYLFSNKNDTILDFCMGSGTTGLACKNLNRNFIGVEKDKQYFDIAYHRILQS